MEDVNKRMQELTGRLTDMTYPEWLLLRYNIDIIFEQHIKKETKELRLDGQIGDPYELKFF